MPNHVATRLTFEGKKERVQELIEFVKSTTTNEKGEVKTNPFDFEKIIPMPKDLFIESGSRGDNGMRYLYLSTDKIGFHHTDDDRAFLKRMEETKKEDAEEFERTLEIGRQYLRNLANYGCTTWYDWSISNWGTKWNSYDHNIAGLPDFIEFSTAWSFAYKVVQELSRKFPDVKIHFIYADEDSGSNTGRGTFINGETTDTEFPESCSKRGYELFLELHPEYEENLIYDKSIDNYHWVEDEDE